MTSKRTVASYTKSDDPISQAAAALDAAISVLNEKIDDLYEMGAKVSINSVPAEPSKNTLTRPIFSALVFTMTRAEHTASYKVTRQPD